MLIDNLKTQLIRDESLRLKPYRDTVGKLTIGVGRNLDDRGITEAEADLMLENDIADHHQKLLENLPWTGQLDEARLGVLIAMSFNMGENRLEGFHQTLSLVKTGNYGAAADEMLNSTWANQVGARAHRLALQMKTGEWQ